MIAEVLTVLSICLYAYQIYQDSKKKGPKEKSTLLEQMRPLFDDLRFSKVAHFILWEFSHSTLKQFVEDTEGITDIEIIKKKWRNVQFFYDNHVKKEVVSRLPKSRPQFKKVDMAPVALTLKPYIEEISWEYPMLLQRIRDFDEQYKRQENEICVEKRQKDFSEINENLSRLSNAIISDADRLVHNYVGFLIFIYDNVFPKAEK